MVRIKKQKTPRKKRVRWLDQIQAQASRPRASYLPPTLDDAGIVKFIHQEAAKQRRAKVNRMAEAAFGQQALCSYTAAQKKQHRRASRHPPMRKKKPAKQKTCLTLMELARAFPNIAQQVCFDPKQSTFYSLEPTPPPRIILLIIMSDIQRLTLISDPTNEFPKNANNIFKVRLPERLTLPGEGWHASLMSLTVPDQGQSNAVIATDPHTKVVTFSVTYLTRKFSNGAYRRVSFKTKECLVKLEEIMSAKQPVTSGNLFWQRVMQEMRNKSMQQLMDEQKYACTHERDERPHVSLKKNWMPTMTWKDNALILHAVREGELLNLTKSKALTTFAINLAVAEKFGLIEPPPGRKGSVVGPQGVNGYKLGPNLKFTLPTVAYDNQTEPVGSSYRRDMNWIGEHFSGIQPADENREVTDQVFQVKNNQLHLSRMVEWQLNNLNVPFEKLVGTSKRTVMVYSDVVESSVVGSGKFPLLREVQLLRTGEGESTVEPLHHQWIKVRGKQLEMVEVEIASTSGLLAILPPGKTLVTIGLKQLYKPPRTPGSRTHQREPRCQEGVTTRPWSRPKKANVWPKS